MGERKQTKNKLRRGHLDTLSARVYFGIGKERLSRRMVTSDWQLTVQCLFYIFFYPTFIFLCPIFVAPCIPLLPVRRLVYWFWQRHLNSISLWQRSRWCLTHSGCWDGKINHKLGELGRGGGGGGREKENKAVLPAATWPPFPVCTRDLFSFLFPQHGKETRRSEGEVKPI